MKTIFIIFLFCLSVGAVPPVTISQLSYDPAMVLYFNFNITGTNILTNEVIAVGTGTLANTDNWTTGKMGYAYAFDGTDDRSVIQDDDDLDGMSSITVACWALMPSYQGGYKPFIIKMQSVDNHNLAPYMIGHHTPDAVHNRWYAMTQTNTGATFSIDSRAYPSGTEIVYGAWYFLVLTWNGANVYLYVNGALQYSSNASARAGTMLANEYTMSIGSIHSASYGKETISEVAIYKNRAMSANEIADLYYKNSKGGIQ